MDLFIWISLSFCTLFFFHVLHFFLTYFVIPQIANMQKMLIKLNILTNKKTLNKKKDFSLLEFFVKLYLQNYKNKKN